MSNGSRKYSGSSSGGNATIDEALKHTLVAAATAENTNQFSWTLLNVRGDYGGVVGKTITVEIELRS